MNRRGFIKAVSSAAAMCFAPVKAIAAIPKAEAVVAPAVAKWWAVGGDHSYNYWAVNARDAIDQYAWDHGCTKGDECPECGGYNCEDHLTKDEMMEVQDHDGYFEAVSPSAWSGLDHDRPPVNADWVRAGFITPCDMCDELGDCMECRVVGELAVCETCFEDNEIFREGT